jgi:outer membrane protein assembly factor BamB
MSLYVQMHPNATCFDEPASVVVAGCFRHVERQLSKEIWRWHGNKALNHWSTPIYTDGYIFGLYGFNQFKTEPLKCLDARTGQEMWTQDGFGQGQMILAGDNLLVQTDLGDLVLVKPDKDGYHEIARTHPFQGEPKCWTDPTVANGHIYARSQTGAVCTSA